MVARAIFNAHLCLDAVQLPVKFYSAVEDRGVHFRLLHEADGQPVMQQLIDKTTEEPVERDAVQRAYELDDRRLVKITPEELATLEPPACREVTVTSFVPADGVDYSLFERPYYLGPDGDAEMYFALSRALAQRRRQGLAHFTMRKRRYRGLLREHEGYLMMITLRPAQEVVDLRSFAPNKKELSKQEFALAEQLIKALKGPFEPDAYRDEYRDRVRDLVARKAKGQVMELRPTETRAAPVELMSALQRSLKSLKKKRA